jgi:hypothetical protein
MHASKKLSNPNFVRSEKIPTNARCGIQHCWPTAVSIDLYRIGYYGGKGGRHVTRLGPFTVAPQPTPPIGDHR